METTLNQSTHGNNQEKKFEFFGLFREYLKIIKEEEIKFLEQSFKNKILAGELEEFVEERDNDVIIVKNDLLTEAIKKEKLETSKIITSKIFSYFLQIKENDNKLNLAINELKQVLDEKNEDPKKLESFLIFCGIDSRLLETKNKIIDLLEVA